MPTFLDPINSQWEKQATPSICLIQFSVSIRKVGRSFRFWVTLNTFVFNFSVLLKKYCNPLRNIVFAHKSTSTSYDFHHQFLRETQNFSERMQIYSKECKCFVSECIIIPSISFLFILHLDTFVYGTQKALGLRKTY